MLPVQQIVPVETHVVAVIDAVVLLAVNVVDGKITDKVAVDNHQTDEDTKLLALAIVHTFTKVCTHSIFRVHAFECTYS